MLEGDRYARILSSDYISYLKEKKNDNIQAAYNTNNNIINWVTYSVLRYDNVEERSNTLIFFVNTAEVIAKSIDALSVAWIESLKS